VKLNPKPGLALTEIWQAMSKGEIKALYIVGADPLLTVGGSEQVREALEKAEFIVCQDIFLNETNKSAHVILPAASFAEKDGTFTNTERRIQRIRKAIEPVGDCRPDWQIVCDLAKRMGAKGFEFDHPAEIMTEIASVTPIYGGISYDRLENGGLQWPCPAPDHPGTPILHVEQFRTPNGKGKFTPLEYKPPMESPDDEYPLILTTDRSLFHFHTGISRKVEGLNILRGQEFLEINPKDAVALGITDGEIVRVISRRGEVRAKALLVETSPRGVVSMTFHFSESPTNVLTNPALDPVAKTPETKVCAVRIEGLKSKSRG
jgi:predicted molibdopterin-dependent oxidoreductase YjgC